MKVKTVQFSMNTQFKCKNSKLSKLQLSYIWLIDRTLSAATTPGQSGPGSNGNEGVFHIPQSSRNIGTSSSDCIQDTRWGSWVLPHCKDAVGVFYSPNQLGNRWPEQEPQHQMQFSVIPWTLPLEGRSDFSSGDTVSGF